MMHIRLKLNERAVLIKDGKPIRALGPGRYTFWTQHDVIRWDTDELAFSGAAAVIGTIPNEWYEQVRLAAGQYTVLVQSPDNTENNYNLEMDICTHVPPCP